MKYLIIANPISGQGKTKENINKAIAYLKSTNKEFELKYSEYPNHAKELAAKISKEDDTTIISMGGDGTIFEIINGINKDVPLIIIPTGSGNDFFRIISNNKDLDPVDILKDSIDGKTCKVDLVKAVRDDIHYIYLNTTSIGIDADINDMASKYIRANKYNKDNAYNISIIKNLFNRKAKHLKVTLDDESKEMDLMLFTIMNGRYYGNGYNPTPNADLQDGLLDIVFVGELSLISLLLALLKYKKGQTDKIKGASLKSAKKIEIKSDVPVNIQSDGENYTCSYLKFEVLDKALTLMIPKYCENLRGCPKTSSLKDD